MKIAFILPSLANKGPIVFTKYLIEGLKRKVDYIEVFYFNNIIELDLGVPTKQISFFEKIDFDEFDIVHTTMAKPDLYGWFHSKALKQKWVVSMHNYYKKDLGLLYGSPKADILSLIWKLALNKANNIIVSSKEMRDYYEKELGDKNYSVISYGISKKEKLDFIGEEDKFLSSLKDNYTIIGSVGLLIQRKGFHQLVNFLTNNPEFAVVIIGNGEKEDYLKELAEKNMVSDRLILLGFKHNSIDYYQYFDIYATTSYSEGFGLAMLEAMSQSIPIICSNLEIYQDYFSDADVGLFEPDNTKSLENAILKVSKDIDYYKIKSYELYENKFSLEAMGNSHVEYYREIINK